MSQPLIIGAGGGKQQPSTTTTNSSTTSPQQSSNRLRHFLKFNGPSNNNNNNNGDLQQKSNGHIDSKSNPQQQQQQHCNTKPSSPLIGRNYPHQRVTKSPSIESTTTTTTKSSSPLLNRCQVINLNPVNVNNHSKQNSFDHHNTGLSSPNLNNNLQSKQHRHSFRCSTSTTNNNNNNSSSSNQLRQSQHTYDNVASLSRLDQQQQSSSMESSPRFVRKNFVRNSIKPTTLTAAASIDQQPSTYGQINSETNSSRWSQQQNMMANNDDNNNDDDDDDDDKHGKQFEWIEIFEPKSRTKMFANLSTGECSWFEPKNVQILRQSNPKITQWWELYDQKSQRFYYYSVKDSKTIWQKPNTVDAIIVPLAKLQIIKQAANNNNSTPLDRIISNSSRTSQPLNNSSSPLSSASSSPSSATNTGRSPQLISPNSATSICIRCRQRPIMVDSFTQTFNNNNNNSSDSIRSSSSKQSMVSRWTQTTSQTPVDIRRLPDLLSDDLRRQQQQQQQHAHQQPSLRHYLLSEARFAARGQTAGGLLNTHPQNNDNDNNRIYDPIAPESIYDPVAQIDDYYDDDYFDVDDDELTDYGDDEDDEISFDSCDADDEFGGEDNSYTDDDEEEEDEDLEDDDDESIINVRNDQKGSSSDSHIVGDDDYDDDYNNEMIFNRKRQQQQSIDDYDIVDYGHHDDHQYISSTKSGTNAGNNNRMPAAAAAASGGISRSTLIQQNLDGPLKMSASFTATDFKRNALGRSSYTTTTTTNQQQQPSAIRYEQPSSSNQREQQRESCPKPAYSNPFNNNSNNGSLRSSTGRINMNLDQSLSNEINNNNNNNKGLGSIADRIQLFNQKSTNLPSKTTTPTPTSPKSIHRQQSISVSAYEPTATAAAGLSRGFLHRSATTEGGGAGGAIAAKQVQKFLQQQQPNNVRTSISPVLDQSSIPCKSTSMTLISPSSSSSSSVVNTTTIQQQQQQSNDPVGSSSNGKRSSLSNKFPVTSNNNNQFDLSFEIPRNNSSISLSPSHQQSYRPFVSSSTPVVPLSSYPIPPPHLHHSAFNQMNDVHKSILVNQANVAASFKNSKNKNSNNQTTTVTKGTANKKNNVILDSNQTVTDSKSLKKSTTTTKTIVKNKDKSNGNGNNSIESFARECVSRHRKGGIFSKKKTLKSMLMHTKKPLKKPMISTISDALLVKESVACFKIIQIFMGDRSPSPTCQQQQQQQQHSTGNSNLSTSTTIGERLSPTTTTTLPYNDDQLLVRLINICVQLVPLRDEVLVQVARQVTQNPNPNSERRGLELMCTLFWYFTASNKLAQHLHAFLFGHRNPFTVIVRRKFEQQMYRSRYTHSHLFYRKPHSIDEVSCVLRAVHSKHVGIFGETLSDALVDSTKLPWPVVLLTEALLEPRHEDREGVFRCVGDMDDVHRLKMKLDTLLPEDRNFNQMIGRSTNNNNDSIIQKTSGKLTDDHDIHVIASTLKLYFRELRDSIIPSQMYLQALECAHDPERACALLDQLEPLNRSTLRYLIHFLQIFSTDEFVRDTKMDDANLSMVWAPNILRSPTTNCQQQQQQLLSGPAAAKAAMINSANIYEHTRAEMSFVRTLIQHLPTNNNNNNNGNDTSPKKH